MLVKLHFDFATRGAKSVRLVLDRVGVRLWTSTCFPTHSNIGVRTEWCSSATFNFAGCLFTAIIFKFGWQRSAPEQVQMVANTPISFKSRTLRLNSICQTFPGG